MKQKIEVYNKQKGQLANLKGQLADLKRQQSEINLKIDRIFYE